MGTEKRFDLRKQEILDAVRLFLTVSVYPKNERWSDHVTTGQTYDGRARRVLSRFAPQLRWVMNSVQGAFELSEDDMPDWRQEARLYVLCYAGILPWPTVAGRHYGLLSEWESRGVRDISAMLATQLRLDMHEAIYRSIRKIPSTVSIHGMIENQEFDIEDPYSEADVYNTEQANRLMRKYPELSMQAIEGMTIDQIIAATGKSRATVFRRIDGQKRSFLSDACQRAGLTVEGDESMEDLEEAYTNVTKVRY